MREKIAEALKSALKTQDKRRLSTLRLIQTAIADRDAANRAAGKDPVSEAEIAHILAKMVAQRELSAAGYEEGGQIELAQQEREEIDVVRAFLPKPLADEQVTRACRQVIDEVGADGLRDMGKCMNALRQKFPDGMDFGKASGIVKTMLR